MALSLRSSHLLSKIKRLGSSGPARSAVVTTSAASIGLLAGKRRDSKHVPLMALGGGAALKLIGADSLGDGAMAAGATIFGYKFGVKHAGPRIAASQSRSAPDFQQQRRQRR